MPPLAGPEYEALKASIAAGYDPARPVVTDENGAVLDGHHRQRACAELGITAPVVVLPGLTEDQKHDYAMRANLACRHLTQLQKRDLIAAELERDPGRSDREIGRLCGADHKTVGSVRSGEIPHPDRGAPALDAAVRKALAASGGKPTDRLVSEVTDAIKRARKIEDRGGIGGGARCTGCVICRDDGIICHYPPERRPGPSLGCSRIVCIDGNGVIYDTYWPADEVREWIEGTTHPWELKRLPSGEDYHEVRGLGGMPLRVAELKRAVRLLSEMAR